MDLLTTLDFLYIALGISTICVAGFLCWGLCELARLLHQANDAVNDTRSKIKRIELALTTMKEHLSSLSGYTSLIAKAGTMAMNYLGEKQKAGKVSSKKKSLQHILEE